MSRNLVYTGIDVDDVSYHGCALKPCTGEALDFHCRPTLEGLERQLENGQDHFGTIKAIACCWPANIQIR